jgi:hypothetical protein
LSPALTDKADEVNEPVEVEKLTDAITNNDELTDAYPSLRDYLAHDR